MYSCADRSNAPARSSRFARANAVSPGAIRCLLRSPVWSVEREDGFLGRGALRHAPQAGAPRAVGRSPFRRTLSALRSSATKHLREARMRGSRPGGSASMYAIDQRVSGSGPSVLSARALLAGWFRDSIMPSPSTPARCAPSQIEGSPCNAIVPPRFRRIERIPAGQRRGRSRHRA